MRHLMMLDHLTRAQLAACVVSADLTAQAIRISSRYAVLHATQAGQARAARPGIDTLINSQHQWLQELAALSHGTALRFYAELDSLAAPRSGDAGHQKHVRANTPFG